MAMITFLFKSILLPLSTSPRITSFIPCNVQVDYRTEHEAKPVIKGLKFAANSWIHLYDYERPNLWGCTGVFD